MVLDSLFGVFAARDRAKMRAEEIASLAENHLPALMEKKEKLEKLINSTQKERLMALGACFEYYKKAYAYCDGERIYNALEGVCQLFGGTLSIKSMQDVQKVLENPNRTGKLRW